MELNTLKEQYEKELDQLNKEIGEKVLRANKLQAKLAVLDDLEQELNQKDATVGASDPVEETVETPNEI
jgi:predicted RNase H-like nuclease (RuvC/YqgF family)